MAHKREILDSILVAGGPTKLGEAAKRLGLKGREIKAQVDRCIKQELVFRNNEKDLIITEKGRQALEDLRSEEAIAAAVAKPIPKPPATPEVAAEVTAEVKPEEAPPPSHGASAIGPPITPKLLPSEAEAGLTEYDFFFNICRTVGLDDQNSGLVTRHIWQGGKNEDLDWLWKGLMQMQVRPDLAARIWHSWRSHLSMGIPETLKDLLGTDKPASASGDGDKSGADRVPAGKGLMSHIIRDNSPVYVGEGYGDMNYTDAIHLCEVRAAGLARASSTGAAVQTPGSMADEMVKVFNAFKDTMGDQIKGKSFIINQDEEGAHFEEIPMDKPVLVKEPRPAQAEPGKSWVVNAQGEVTEVPAGKPIVIQQSIPATVTPPVGRHWLYDKATGKVEEVTADQPIIIAAQPAQQPQSPMISFQDPQGNPFTLDLSTYFKLEDHKNKVRREDEAHDVKIEIAKGAKDLVEKATRAFARMED